MAVPDGTAFKFPCAVWKHIKSESTGEVLYAMKKETAECNLPVAFGVAKATYFQLLEVQILFYKAGNFSFSIMLSSETQNGNKSVSKFIEF